MLTDRTAQQLAELHPTLARRLLALFTDSHAPVGIVSGRRTRAQQQRLYELFLAGKGNPANPPGRSKHELGLAADLAWQSTAGRAWAHRNAARYGLRFPIPREPWHIEPDGTPDPPDEPEEDDVARLIKAPDSPQVFGTDGTVRWHVPKPSILADLIRARVYGDGAVTEVAQETIDALPLANPVT